MGTASCHPPRSFVPEASKFTVGTFVHIVSGAAPRASLVARPTSVPFTSARMATFCKGAPAASVTCTSSRDQGVRALAEGSVASTTLAWPINFP